MNTSKTTNRIVRSSLSEQAAQKIKSWILSLQLHPGERLIVDNLAEELEISRTPIREGLQRLVTEGLVVYDGKSYTVAELSQQDLENLFEIRCALEVLAARQASVRISHDVLEALYKWTKECEEHQQDKNTEFLIPHDMRFHQLVCEGAKNPKLTSLLNNLNVQIWWSIRRIYSSKDVQYLEDLLLQEHQIILKSIANHEPDRAAHLMEQHIRRAEKDILQHLATGSKPT